MIQLTDIMKRKSSILLLITLMLFVLNSCRTEYTTQHFSFPPGTKPHENDWEYTALIIVSSPKRPISIRSKKEVQIKIYDKGKNVLLKESFKFTCASINAKVEWNKFEKIKVELFEVGNEYVKDQQNAELIKSGPKSLITLKYEYDQKNEKFRKEIIK